MTTHATLGVEALERRDCPATANLFDGILTVVGSDGGEDIIVTESGDRNWIFAAGQTFAAAAVNRIVISGGAGNDFISNRAWVGAVIYGGQGNDVLMGGPGNDVIYGGQGNDTIYGRRGDDKLFGGGGTKNHIIPGPGNDTFTEGDPQVSADNSDIESQIITLINNYRMANGVAPLAVSGQLNAAADIHSADMVAVSNAYGPWVGLQHELFGTAHPEITDRLDAVGYDTWTRSFSWGENIAYGYKTALDVVNAWIDSPDHRANILDPSFTETGVSARVDDTGHLFFTQDFGAQS